MSVVIKISNITDVRSASIESFVDGELHFIDIWNGFNFGDLLRKIRDIMTQKGEEEFNLERILFYTKDGNRFDFGYDDKPLKNDDYFNVGIIEERADQMRYAHSGDLVRDEKEDEEVLKKRKEKFLSLLRLNTEESLNGMAIEGNRVIRAFVEPVYSEGPNPVRIGTSFSVESIEIDGEIEEQLKEMGI